jgi:hypothetical protein
MSFEYKHTSPINVIETSPLDNFIALGDKTGLTLQKFQLSKSNEGQFSVATKGIRNESFLHIPTNDARVTSISFSQSEAGKFAFTTSENDLFVFQGDKLISKQNPHTQSINSCAFLGKTHILTCSDDHTAKLTAFDSKDSVYPEIRKYSNIVKVSTHSDHTDQFILSEELGVNSIHDTRSMKETSKFYTETKNVKPKQPLYDSHWHPIDSNLFASVADYEFFIWDLRNTKNVLFKSVAHHTGAVSVRWSHHGTKTLATCTAYDIVSIHNLTDLTTEESMVGDKTMNRPQHFQQKHQVGGLAWSNTEPDFCITGCDNTLKFWNPNL